MDGKERLVSYVAEINRADGNVRALEADLSVAATLIVRITLHALVY
jgi:hypothetical protein